MKTLITLAALGFMAVSAYASEGYGTPPSPLPDNCRLLNPVNDLRLPTYRCDTGYKVSTGGSPVAFCEMKKNADAKECQSCGRDKKDSKEI